MPSPEKPARWRRSSFSNGNGGNCIEVDDSCPGTVRDSKDPNGPRLRFTPDAWAAFVHAAVDGEFGDV
ncbi:hypothetical protein GCM10009639_22900 [Kitasatospora putterlickiae]|uniref:DUF397 domain-containing protein n=1 Tax=Kitasatospora putterlickiae TaxID=221725 RepID=A0ABP4IMU6_9ACTN